MMLRPNAAALVSWWLRGRPEIHELLADRVYCEVPREPQWPLARVVRYGGAPVTDPLWLDEAALQIDCWGGTRWQAWQAAETIRSLLADLPGTHPDAPGGPAVVTAVRFGPLSEDSDPAYTPARPVCRIDVTVLLHP